MINGQFNLQTISSHFELKGNYRSSRKYDSGHINDTFLVETEKSGVDEKYIFQRINHNIFKDPTALMENISRIIFHLEKIHGQKDSREHLTIIKTKEGKHLHIDNKGNYWRAYLFIRGARTYDVLQNPRQAYEAAKTFGRFQKDLSSMKDKNLNIIIPDFHDTPKRMARLLEVIEKDPLNRAKIAKEQIDFVLKRADMVNTVEKLKTEQKIPIIITHNDTKINNVMFDDKTGAGVCVIDLDTVMPGVSLYDFGDMIRSSGSSSAEDERDLSKVKIRLDVFESLANGYIDGTGENLNDIEMSLLPFSGKLITMEIGIRFLTDFIEGDVYFKVHRINHNLDRCRVQTKLVESIEKHEEEMEEIVSSLKSQKTWKSKS
ncbi:MAG TPA: aminoglycoside phosphotransferase family protein [Victivallales bacterium]|nr:aminoglycoside phosphotransferase family protein [Victivallales bacterium]